MAVSPHAPVEEDKPAPMPLLTVQSFINTLDVEQGTDVLHDPGAAAAWLAAAGLVAPDTIISAEQLAEARAVRESLRALVQSNGDGSAPSEADLRALRRLAEDHRPTVLVDTSGRIGLQAGGTADVRDGLLALLLAVADAQANETWPRLKLCANPDCSWAFFDRSRNRQGAWCTMASCGNRLKNRRFRARGG